MTSCIFTLIKDEQEYLYDFLKWHTDIGIDRIFVYEDIGSISHKHITDNFENVELHSIDELVPNRNSLHFQRDCIRKGVFWIKVNYNYDWCFAIDCDEFIAVGKSLRDLLENFKEYNAIKLQWKNYGYSGHVKKPIYNKPIWEIYTKECGYSNYDKRYGCCTKMCYNLHTFEERYVLSSHKTRCNWIKPDFTRSNKTEVFGDLYIKHYITKSLEEYQWKLNHRGMLYQYHRTLNDFYEINQINL